MKKFVGTIKRIFGGDEEPLAGQPSVTAEVTARSAATVTAEREGSDETSPPPRPTHGTVGVHRNALFVTNPTDGGLYATCLIPEDERLTVTIDDEPRIGEMIMSVGKVAHVTLTDAEPARHYTLSVSSDQMTVSMHATLVFGHRLFLKDTGPARKILLEIDDEPILPPIDPIDVLQMVLAESKYTGQIDEQALFALSRTTKDTTAPVLYGTPPTAGRSARYRQIPLPAEFDPLHKRMRLPTLSAGTPIAVFEPETAGVPGQNVFGELIPARTDRRLPLLGAGVALIDGQLVATRGGRVVFTNAKIDVLPELVIQGDLTPRDGQVVFDGDVKVLGSVLDGSLIKATGVVSIAGDVLGATVESERGVTISGNAVQAKILAGLARTVHAQIHNLLKETEDEWRRFRAEYALLAEAASSRSATAARIPLLASVLLDQRYTHLTQFIDGFLNQPDAQYFRHDDAYQRLAATLKAKWTGIQRTRLNPTDVDDLLADLYDYRTQLETLLADDPAPVRAGGVSASQIHATGNVVVQGTGVFSSHIESGESVAVRGVVRGGFLIAEREAHIAELGSPMGVESSVQVNRADGLIDIKTRHPNTLLDLAGHRNRNTETEYGIRWRRDHHESSTLSRR